MTLSRKQQIINEIKRTANLNNGVPLGVGRFFQETGIKVTDWRGKIWIRWSDAVRDAGLKPNQLNQAYHEVQLIEQFIPFIRELGHFPVAAEIRLKGRQDKSFRHTMCLVGLAQSNSLPREFWPSAIAVQATRT